ncbi:MAG: ImmA/IrrE family metallo-endopeptidase [Candidatus Heimdallarchaeaceae archaeon]
MPIEIRYHGKRAAVIEGVGDGRRRAISLNIALTEFERREVEAIALGYFELHRRKRRLPTADEAECFALHLLMPRNIFPKNLVDYNAEELSQLARVSVEFAEKRLEYERRARR